MAVILFSGGPSSIRLWVYSPEIVGFHPFGCWCGGMWVGSGKGYVSVGGVEGDCGSGCEGRVGGGR